MRQMRKASRGYSWQHYGLSLRLLVLDDGYLGLMFRWFVVILGLYE